MDEPTRADLPLMVKPQHCRGNRVAYEVRFNNGKPYPWHPRRGLIRNVNWQNWLILKRVELVEVPQVWTLSSGPRLRFDYEHRDVCLECELYPEPCVLDLPGQQESLRCPYNRLMAEQKER